MDPVASTLDELGVAWVVAGALATMQYRDDDRFTTDLDLLVEWDERLPDALAAAGYTVRSMRLPDDHPHLLQLRRGSQRVDLIVAVVPYQAEAIARGRAGLVLTPEDVIVHKLIAWRGRDRDDIRAVLEHQTDLDEEYIDHWVAEWEIGDRWEEAKRRYR